MTHFVVGPRLLRGYVKSGPGPLKQQSAAPYYKPGINSCGENGKICEWEFRGAIEVRVNISSQNAAKHPNETPLLRF